jgi:hypothetical protein
MGKSHWYVSWDWIWFWGIDRSNSGESLWIYLGWLTLWRWTPPENDDPRPAERR